LVDRVRSVIRPFFDEHLYVNVKRLFLLISLVCFSFVVGIGDRPFSFIASRGRLAIFFYCFSLAIDHFLLLLLAGDRPFSFIASRGRSAISHLTMLFSSVSCA